MSVQIRFARRTDWLKKAPSHRDGVSKLSDNATLSCADEGAVVSGRNPSKTPHEMARQLLRKVSGSSGALYKVPPSLRKLRVHFGEVGFDLRADGRRAESQHQGLKESTLYCFHSTPIQSF